MEFNLYTLPNGIRCIHKQVRSGVVHCALTINTGSRDELDSEHGLAHLLEHSFFKGTEKRKAYHINCRLENLGGELNAYTTKEETVIHTSTLKTDFSKAAELISDIVFHSTFPEKEIEKEKIVIVDEINSYKDSPTERIYDEFEDMLFAGSSLGHNILGRKKSVMGFTRDNLNAFIGRCYNTPEMVFSVIGNISPEKFREVCDRYFTEIPRSERKFKRDTQLPSCPRTKKINRGFHQAHCIAGNYSYSLSSSDRIAMSLLTNILGGPSANSLLNMEIRERRGLAYSIEAGYTPYTDTGISSIYFGSESDNIDLCLQLVKSILDKIKRDGVTPRVFGMAKKQFIGQMLIAMESNENYMMSVARSYLIHDNVDSVGKICEKIESLEQSDIIRVTREVFGNDLSMLIYSK